ncbi:MAG: TetR family transcriptional regulator [Halieaceae bacterium]|nr:MAG: TetR family transcriptional regulator [Halieaceae bacterium]
MKSEGMSDASGVMTEEVPQAIGKRRQIRPRAERRQQLIDATIRCIAQHGLSKVTMQMVTSEAGLSVGIANLHFQSKDNLLKETLRSVAEEYHGGQIEIMEGSDMPDLGHRLDALLDFQLGRGVTQRQKMSVWFAYYGEAGARPVYQKIVSTVDRLAAQKLEALFSEIIQEGQYRGVEARELATGYSALIDGLHLGLLVTPRELTKRRARAVARDFLRRAFPQHIC